MPVLSRPPVPLATFHAACWVLGLVAFVELVALGAALALREERTTAPEVMERVVTEYVFEADAPAGAGGWSASSTAPGGLERATPTVENGPPPERPVQVAPSPRIQVSPPVAIPTMAPQPLSAPVIADPVVERLVGEAREARVAGDTRLAIVKLEEAAERAPRDPHVLYLFGEVFEAIGHYDRAADSYQAVFELGTTGAGGLYAMAGRKLSTGFTQSSGMEGKVAIGRIRQFNDTRVTDGEKVIIEIPIMAAPGQELIPENVEVVVRFFDKLDGEIVPAAPENVPETEWVTSPVDWSGNAEETLRAAYFISHSATPDAHLFGQRSYFGHVVELNYEGELLDHQAWPRLLATQVDAPGVDPLILPREYLPPNTNPDNPLLPPLPQR